MTRKGILLIVAYGIGLAILIAWTIYDAFQGAASGLGSAFLSSAPLAIGDTVQYRKAWLQSTGNISGPLPFARGIVRALNPFGSDRFIADVDWGAARWNAAHPCEPDAVPSRVLASNLERVGGR